MGLLKHLRLNPELKTELERLRQDIRSDSSKLPILFWLRAYTILALERDTVTIRWSKLSGFVSRTAREFGINGLDHAPGRALLTDYALLQAVPIDGGEPVTAPEQLRALDLGRQYHIELRGAFQSELARVHDWVVEAWDEFRSGESSNALAGILARWAPLGPSGLLPALIEAQELEGWLSRETLVAIAQGLCVPLSQVYGVADFYAHLYTKPVGKVLIRICDDVPCYLAGSSDILHRAKNMLWLREGETTEDRKYTLEQVPCLGHCDRAPVAMIGSQLHEHLTPEKIAALLKRD
jgi:NADH:ubiquinone oxidoreductase subunit E